MTPWDVVIADSLPSSVEALALGQADFGPQSLDEVRAILASVPPGVWTWTDGPALDPEGGMASRPASVTLRGGQAAGAVSVQGVALVDTAGSGTLLLVVWLGDPVGVSGQGGAVVGSGSVVVTRGQ